jgi:hypothetical protein
MLLEVTVDLVILVKVVVKVMLAALQVEVHQGLLAVEEVVAGPQTLVEQVVAVL